MKLHFIATLSVVASILSGCASMSPAPLSNKQKAVEVINNLGTADRSSLNYISDKTYIQHNLSVASGKAGLFDALDNFPAMPKDEDGTVIRALQDGDYVVTHSYVKAFNSAVFDIFRFDNGLIVEHWDNIQEQANQPNMSGHTLTDGTTQITDLDKTQQNKVLIKNLVQEIFVEGKLDKLGQYFNQETYIEHNPWGSDGFEALKGAFTSLADSQAMTYDKMHAVLGEGNFVLTVGEGTSNGTPTAFYDLFRVEEGLVVEHWDVIKAIPPKEEQMNNNGKFNFPASALQVNETE